MAAKEGGLNIDPWGECQVRERKGGGILETATPNKKGEVGLKEILGKVLPPDQKTVRAQREIEKEGLQQPITIWFVTARWRNVHHMRIYSQGATKGDVSREGKSKSFAGGKGPPKRRGLSESLEETRSTTKSNLQERGKIGKEKRGMRKKKSKF